MGTSTGEKIIITAIIAGAGMSTIFSIWIINSLIASSKTIDYIVEVVTDIRTMKRTEYEMKQLLNKQ